MEISNANLAKTLPRNAALQIMAGYRKIDA
jgi:hypothetical protein